MKQLSEQLHDAALAVQSIEAVSEYRQRRLQVATSLINEVVAALFAVTPTEFAREFHRESPTVRRMREFLKQSAEVS